ncbi:MAG: hypothetical protein QT08_C0019G0024 [archaeon GW2011_AR17]|nr:MAG: hypothetical protein QT08_C0019G0024 [archaeon GW2011_AR17]MBS3154726.1 hypothetical protein [Candidatus Woesearchaeota archaeon]HIH15757.1 hypothetical protein [Nanoarchaeota archaeon]HIH58431.1 hypothetical protein [Nanoarchaeota archaeon]HII13719.1 hypothetical protein [Nanoarchaeota archaeon]
MKSRTEKILEGIKEDKIFGGKEKVDKFIEEASRIVILLLAIIGIIAVLKWIG